MQHRLKQPTAAAFQLLSVQDKHLDVVGKPQTLRDRHYHHHHRSGEMWISDIFHPISSLVPSCMPSDNVQTRTWLLATKGNRKRGKK